MTNTFRFLPLLSTLSILLLIGIVGCAPKMDENVKRGSSYNFQPGYPEFYISSFGFLNENDQPTIKIMTDILYSSLVYFNEDSDESSSVIEEKEASKEANVIVEMTATPQFNGNLVTESFSFDISRATENQIEYETFSLQKNFAVEFGNYKVSVTVTDPTSGKSVTRTDDIVIPHPGSGPYLSDIVIFGKDNEDTSQAWQPLTTYDISKTIDSLRFLVQLNNDKGEVEFMTQLSFFRTDTSYAARLHYLSQRIETGAHDGFFYQDETVIDQNLSSLSGSGHQLYEFTYPRPPRGNYRFIMKLINHSNNNNGNTYKARDFGVKSENYPQLKTARELTRPLIYLMDEKKYKQMLKISEPDSLKVAVDHFWLSNIEDEQEALEVLQLYYERVEEANKQFSNFKEGWKTDPGMVYILFGPPWYNLTRGNTMIWYYSFNRQDPNYYYEFVKPVTKHDSYPFDHWILERKPGCFDIHQQQLNLWLSGIILNRPIY